MLIRFSENERLPSQIKLLSEKRDCSRHRVALQALRLGLDILLQRTGELDE